jgi:murein DD-endopeptidase MepM/ murein hydrolase activator NlpD
MTRRLACLLLLLLAAAPRAGAQQVVRRVGRVTIRVDLSQAFPGGVAVVRLSGTRLGSAWALLDGRRAPFYVDHGTVRALVPVDASAEPGEATLGIGLLSRSGEQRIPVPITIAPRTYPPREVSLGESQRTLLGRPEVARDARRLLGHVRTESSAPTPGPLAAPVAATGRGYGETRSCAGGAALESTTDGLTGERHRGVDYAVPAGTPVRSPGAGTVLFAGPLALTGETVVVDHGQGVVSVLQHLSRVKVSAGDSVSTGTEVGLSGDTGLVHEPLLQWRIYLHTVPVDPLVLAAILG